MSAPASPRRPSPCPQGCLSCGRRSGRQGARRGSQSAGALRVPSASAGGASALCSSGMACVLCSWFASASGSGIHQPSASPTPTLPARRRRHIRGHPQATPRGTTDASTGGPLLTRSASLPRDLRTASGRCASARPKAVRWGGRAPVFGLRAAASACRPATGADDVRASRCAGGQRGSGCQSSVSTYGFGSLGAL